MDHLKQTDTSKYLIENNWWLLKIFASKNPLHTLRFVIPLIVFWIIGIARYSRLEDVLPGIALGSFLWSFIEYAIHRWVFHYLSDIKILTYSLGSFHLYHHGTPRDPRVYTSGLVPALFWSALIIGSLYLLNFSLSLIMITGLTLSLSYFIYEWVHYLVHVVEFKNPIMAYLQKFHVDHHISKDKNYGQTSPLWDLALATYKKPDNKKTEVRLKHFLMEDL